MDFGQALEALKERKKVARSGWIGKGIFIELQLPNEYSKMTHPFISIDTTGLQTDNPHAPKSRVPWLASQTDMLAEDWVVLEQDKKVLKIMGTELKDLETDLKKAIYNFLNVNGYLPTKIEVDKNTYTKVLYQVRKALDFTSIPPTFPLSKTIYFMDIPIVEMD